MTEQPDQILGALLSLDTGVALADPASWQIVFENAAFFRFFPAPEAGAEGASDTLFDRIPGLDGEKAKARLAAGRRYEHTADVRIEPRTFCLRIVLSALEGAEVPRVLVEVQNVTKQREAEYMLDSYSRMSEKNARELGREKERVEKLLLNIMPRTVYEELRDYGTTTPQKFEVASVLMLDFVDFTEMAVARDPGALIAELNDIFSAFDRVVELFDCERIKTIGDAYLAVAGLPDPHLEHAPNLARVALRLKRYLEKRNAAHPTQWRFRIGIASGPLIGSVVGIQKYVYDVFGPAVNLASRIEGVCEPMKITLCDRTRELLGPEFVTRPLAESTLKGFGAQTLHVLEYEERI